VVDAFAAARRGCDIASSMAGILVIHWSVYSMVRIREVWSWRRISKTAVGVRGCSLSPTDRCLIWRHSVRVALYYGDNFDVLRRQVADESVDLVYLDPPLKSD
jgi:hypothetical protein